LKIAAIIPVKTFSLAKTRLDLSSHQKEEICKIMLEEILHTLSISPQIDKIIIVTKESKAIELAKKYNVVIISDNEEKSVNNAVALADKYLLENKFDASIVFPQDIPFIKTQDIDFMLNYKIPPMPIDLMITHYDEDSYKIHMNTAKEVTRNVALVFVKRIMLDVDNMKDLKFLLEQNEKPEISKKIKDILDLK
jgi:2-phospho-L-lactate guanylyltransferase